ncbi:MAG: class I SAM-dependent methyltransferase [Pseudomonadota bacterium]
MTTAPRATPQAKLRATPRATARDEPQRAREPATAAPSHATETPARSRRRTNGHGETPRWFETFYGVLKRIEAGRIEIVLPDGREFAAEGRHAGPTGRILVYDDDFFSRMAREGENGFCEMYIEGGWDTPDLQSLFDVILMNNDTVGRGFPGQALVRIYERFRHWLRANTRSGARKNISFHYDLGNAFYAEWLDASMTYSSALFSAQGEELEQAQANKYAAICDRLELKPGQRVLEIGCGWGGFAEYAIRERGVHVTGLTLSREQLAYARERLERAGLAERAELVLRDYRDERGRYDAIASIEMFEAVGERYWPVYFAAVRDRLNPGGRAALQVITIADRLFTSYRKGTDFIQKFVFPGGMLPSPSALQSEIDRAGLSLVGSTEFGESYSRTLRAWRERFNARWEAISGLGFDDRFHRLWNLYLATCGACFHAGTTDVTQVTLTKTT